MAAKPRKKQPPTKSTKSTATSGPRTPARATAARTPQKQFPVFWVALGVVIVIAGIAAIVASSSGSDSESGGSGAATGHEYGTVTVTGKPLPPLPDSGKDPAVGDTIPTLKGENFKGQPVTIAPNGKAQMIVFLAHWCPHCNAEAPKLAAYLTDHGGTPENVDLTIVPTGSQDTAPNWPPSQWVKDMNLGNVTTLVDDKESTAAAAFGLTAYPFIVAVDQNGAVVDRRSGEQADGFFDEAFTALANGSNYPE
jgi:thiol-disulfide isomerase/thioredoxin